MNGLILLFILIVFPAILISLFFNKKVSQCMPLSIIANVTVVYIFGLFNNLLLGVYIVCFVSIFTFIILVFLLLKKSYSLYQLKSCFSLPFFTFVFSLFAFYFLYRGRLLVSWDEFSHWGDVVKVMHSYNVLSTNQLAGSAFQSYPPGQSIFLYIAQVLNGVFDESILFMSQQFLLSSLLFSIIDTIKNKKPVYSFILCLCIYLLPAIFFDSYYSSILIDSVISIVFFIGIINILVNESKGFLLLNTMMFSLFLVMIKDAGKVFAIFLIIFYVLFMCINKVRTYSTKAILRNMVIVILPAIIFVFSWKFSISINQATVSFSAPVDLKILIQSLFLTTNSYRDEVVVNFFTAMKNTPVLSFFGFNLSVSSITLLVLMIYTYLKHTCNKKSSIILMGIVSFYIYYLGLLVSYLFKFSSYEALKLASYTRYVNVGLLGFISILIIGGIVLEKESKNLNTQLLLLCTMILCSNAPLQLVETFSSKHDTIAQRSQYNEITYKSLQLLPNTRNDVFILSTKTTGFDYWVIRFNLRGIIDETNSGFFSIGKKSSNDDIWTKELSIEELSEVLKNYEYLLIYKSDQDFIDLYSKLFENPDDIENNAVFKINESKNNVIISRID